MKRESKWHCLAGADPKGRRRTGGGGMRVNVLQRAGEGKADRKVKSDPREPLEGKIA